MNISKTTIPDFPRIIRRYKYSNRKLSLNDKKDDVLKNIKKIRINKNTYNRKRVVYPELFIDKWCPLVVDNNMLISAIPAMVSTVTDKRVFELEAGWKKWLDKWVKHNKLKVSFVIDKKEPEPELRKRKRKKAKGEEEEVPVELEPKLEEETEEVEEKMENESYVPRINE